MVKKTYKELLEGLKYGDLGYTGERKPLTDPKYKQFTDTINKNAVIANTHIDSSLPTMPQAQVSGQGTTIPTAKVDGQNPWAKNRRNNAVKDTKSTEASTVGSETTVGGATPETVPTTDTPLTIDAKYSDFTKWAKEHGVDSDKVFQDAMSLARSQYEQARATYGLQAEQLAQAGLTNSGVSDNMERVAYAQKVQAEQAALDQKAALDQANKEGFSAYQEEQKQKQQQYTNLYQQLVDGYEDEYGNIHAGVSPEMAVAQLKFAGLNDETMIAEAQKAYGEYKQVYDKQQADRQNAIAGTVTDDKGNVTFDSNSLFGKLFDGTLDSEDFLDQIQKDYGVRFNTDEEAVDALLKEGKITKEQSSMFYRETFVNSINAVAESGEGIETNLKNGNSALYTAIKSASDAYQNGKMSDDDWQYFKEQLLNGKNSFSAITTMTQYDAITGGIVVDFEMGLGNTSTSFNVVANKVDNNTSSKLDSLANGSSIVMMNGKLYIKPEKASDVIYHLHKSSLEKWYEIPSFGSGTIRTNAYQILKLISQPTKSKTEQTSLQSSSRSEGRHGGR